MGRLPLSLLLTAGLAACMPAQQRVRPEPVAHHPPVAAPSQLAGGMDAVMGRDAGALIARFGAPGLDLREGPARKLQFLGPACVLDAYLYPPRGGGEPVVTHVDARTADGSDIDRAACVEALSRR